MSSPPQNPREEVEGGRESPPETSQRTPTAQKIYVAPQAAQLPSKLQFVAVGAPGPSGIKQCFRTVKAARRVPTLPRKFGDASDQPGVSTESEQRLRAERVKRHICSTCDKRFSSPGKLNQHILSHTGELPFSCELCDKKFNSKFKLARHSLIHSEARAFACNICARTFNRKDHLTNHVRIHNPVKKLFTCDIPDCKKSYTSYLSYRKHAALHSAEQGNLQCKICDEVFTNKHDIIFHLKVHSGSRTVKNETDKKFTCSYCDRRFFTAKDVRRHLVVHTGRRDFICPFCPQKFGRKDHLVRHVKNAHPDESWKSATASTSSEQSVKCSLPELTIEPLSFNPWDPSTSKDSSLEAPTRIPSSEIVVELPSDLDIKVEPLEVSSEECVEVKIEELPIEYPVVYMVPPYTQSQSNIPFIQRQPLPETIGTHLMDPSDVPSLLIDPGEGPSGLAGPMMDLVEESESPAGFVKEESNTQQRLPAFTQAFQTAQSPKPPQPQ